MIGLAILLAVLVVQALLLTVAIGGNADLCRQNRRLRREAAQLRAQVAQQRPVDLDGLRASTCVCSHTIGQHADLGCDGDPACTCGRDRLAAALDAGLLTIPAGVA